MKQDRIEIIISGIGGQGVVYSANLLSRAALYQHKFSSSIAHYGPESRGSVTTSEVVISNPTTPLIPLNKGGIKGGYFPLTKGEGGGGYSPLTKGEGGCLDYPCVESPDIFIAMHQKGFDHHITNHKMDVSNLKYLIYDSTIVNCELPLRDKLLGNCEFIPVPASQLAKEKLKNIMMANIILTAALVKATGIITRENLKRALKQMAPPKDYQLNLQAIELGYLGV
jgi:2-oxoglutarate ferredoxin oxidoreductase subunit gamma